MVICSQNALKMMIQANNFEIERETGKDN